MGPIEDVGLRIGMTLTLLSLALIAQASSKMCLCRRRVLVQVSYPATQTNPLMCADGAIAQGRLYYFRLRLWSLRDIYNCFQNDTESRFSRAA